VAGGAADRGGRIRCRGRLYSGELWRIGHKLRRSADDLAPGPLLARLGVA
jgi:hypothetical protein